MIFADWRRGTTLTDLAAKHGIARQVVGRIVASFHPELEEDVDRALYRGEMWRLYDEMGEVFRNPGWKLTPRGDPAEGPDGEPAIDVNAKIQAGEVRLKVITELRKLDGRDKPQKSHVTVDLAQQQASAFLAEVREKIAADNREREALRRAAVIPGQVERPAIEG